MPDAASSVRYLLGVLPIPRRRSASAPPAWLLTEPTEKRALPKSLGVGELRRHARTLAARHRLATERRRDDLLHRLTESARLLQESHRVLARAPADSVPISPGGAWLLENYQSVMEHVRLLRRRWTRGEAPELPLLEADGSARSMPRAYHLALELINHVDGQLELESLHAFVTAYQGTRRLSLRELWAMPDLVRLALLETLRDASLRVAGQHLQPLGGSGAEAQRRLEAGRRSVERCIGSLRRLDRLSWRGFVESQSELERILRLDPAGVHARMSFASRDAARQAVEHLASGSALSEEQVARRAVKLAREARPIPRGDGQEPRPERHVGYYLVGRGRGALEECVGFRPSLRQRLGRLAGRAPVGCYLGAIVTAWAALIAAGVALLRAPELSWPSWVALAGAYALAAAQAAVSLVNLTSTLVVRPRPTMRLDFSDGIPAEHRTLVVVPTLLTPRTARTLTKKLEVHFHANRDDNLLFALLTDFADADQETLPLDEALLGRVRSEIERLNRRYCSARSPTFLLLHRPRKWNASEGVWMGEERKRGKLAALNRLVLTGATDAFSVVVGEVEQLASVRYVITLDDDTLLPRDAARELIGCIAHPLNRPRLDPRGRRVVDGHAILQPRVAVTAAAAGRSLYSWLFAADVGVDPYTSQTSDVYQDLFDAGSFVGKGIYDVQALERTLADRFPPNRVLSHDLIEGCLGRSGLVSDVELFEDTPSSFAADLGRRHRWIRGDWQIASWLWSRVPGADGTVANPLDKLSRWKIFDNLRRSLTPILLMTSLLLGWLLAPGVAGVWTLVVLGLDLAPSMLARLSGLVRRPPDKPRLMHLSDQLTGELKELARVAANWSLLPARSYCYLDAVVRSLFRLHLSRRKLLEWVTARETEDRGPGGACAPARLTAAGVISALGGTALLWAAAPQAFFAAGPVFLGWLLGPVLARRLSWPRRKAAAPTAAQERQLRRWARQTWHYFETWGTAGGRGLPPDHVRREADSWRVDPRTSPTSIGMALVGGLAACDLGYLPASELLERTSSTLVALHRLPRYRGHFFNWYDARTCEPMTPRYVSSVDSGNLWGALVVLGVGLRELADHPLVPPRLLEGLHDTVETVAGVASLAPDAGAPLEATLRELRRLCTSGRPVRATEACRRLAAMQALSLGLLQRVPSQSTPLRDWVEALALQVDRAHRYLRRMAFWVRLPQHRLGDLPRGLRSTLETLDAGCALGDLPVVAARVADSVSDLVWSAPPGLDRQGQSWLTELQAAANAASAAASSMLGQASRLAGLCDRLGSMDFQFLLDEEQGALAVGFSVREDRKDASCYDLLASEARLASFLAVASQQLPAAHWSSLGRPITLIAGQRSLLSWSGSMFEYLMPLLIMPCYPGTLLEASCRAAVEEQIRHARRRGLPLGVSESSHSRREPDGAYGYAPFGVPRLALGPAASEQRTVVAPYAAALASLVRPDEACRSLEQLERLGGMGPYGFYDAIEFTRAEERAEAEPVVCETMMSHHAGMALLALAGVLVGGTMQRRFLEEPSCRAHELLLQERVPDAVCPVSPRQSAETKPTSEWREKRIARKG